jgi:hypothetical protein
MLHYLLERKRLVALVVAVSTLVGLAAAKLNTSGGLHVAVAATHVLIDYPEPSIVERRAMEQHLTALQKRAEIFGRLMVTTPVLEHIGRRAGIPGDQIAGVARTTANVPLTLREPGSEVRAAQIRDSQVPYHLELQSSPAEPILSIYSQAPTEDEAKRLANAAIAGLEDYLDGVARQDGIDQLKLARMRQLGDARGGVINPSAPKFVGLLTFMVAFGLTAVALLGLIYRRYRRFAAHSGGAHLEPDDGLDNWPHTTRALPWLIAGFIAMLWLVPFNKIELAMSMPIDMKLDRLVLPFIVGTWLLAFMAGGRYAPRLRMTWIHIALGTFLACAFLSVVLDARYLNQTLEFDLAFKKLPLLVSYLSIFVIVASAVRPGEVRAFMTLTLGLAVITGLGIVFELRFKQNLFSVWTDKVLPGFFHVELADSTVVDSQGRRGIVGPAEVGLEAVSMLSMALPIVLVGIVSAGQERRQRILYALAACALVAGTLATGRKSALIAPAAVVLTLAYFRRRELLSLAPLGLVVGAVVTVLSPGMIGGIVSQFTRSDASTVATTSDRTADYDAIRPDLWTHILFGRGFGSYNHDTYRILDSEILGRTVETGVLGLAAFLMIGLAVVFAARRTIALRDPVTSSPALIGAAVAVCFIVVSTLFDVLSFPHATYIFLYMAGLTTVVVGRESAPATPPPEPAERFVPADPEPHEREPLVAAR